MSTLETLASALPRLRRTTSLLALGLALGACADQSDDGLPDDVDAQQPGDEPVYELVARDYPFVEGDETICALYEADLGDGIDQRREFYLLDRMNEELAEDPEWSEYFGLPRVETCDEAREYQVARAEYELDTFAPPPIDDTVYPAEPAPEQVDKIGEADGESNNDAVVRLLRDGKTCSGTMIHPRFVLTAAHCFNQGSGSVSIRREENGVVQDWVTKSAYFHRHFDYTGIGDPGDDIGMVVFDTAVTGVDAGADTMRVLVSPMQAGDDIVFLGWGIATHEGTGSDVLRYGAVDINWASTRWFKDVVNQGGARICKGDSGGPARLERGSNDLTYDLVGGMASQFEVGSEYCPYPNDEQHWSSTADKIEWIETRLMMNGINLTPEEASTACPRFTQSGRTYMRCWE